MENISAAQPAQTAFHEINTGERKLSPDTLNPRATRYGFAPIWPVHGLPSTAFKMHSLPGSRFVPFRVFEYPLTNEHGVNNNLERLPLEQVSDLYTVAGEKFATDFPELAALDDEAKAREIVGLLTNPNQCEKYPVELKNTCATCWVNYLRGEAPSVLAERYADDPRIFTAAGSTLRLLLTSLDNAVAEAATLVDVALREVDDPKAGKDRFYDVDYINIMNSHKNMPEFRTTTNPQASMDNFTKAIEKLAVGRSQDVGLTADDVRGIVAETTAAKDTRIAELEAQLAGKTADPFQAGVNVICEGGPGVIREVKTAGWYSVELESGQMKSLRKDALALGGNNEQA